MCSQMIVAAIFYVSSSLALSVEPPLDDDEYADQEQYQADSIRILSSLYCQLLLSPESSQMRVREERIFYETLIFFLDVCVCFSIDHIDPDMVYELISSIFRRGLQDPHARRKSEFLPITEIVRRHWLAQRVPGKNRAEIAHSTLHGTTQLIQPLCEKNVSNRFRGGSSTKQWNETGFPVDTKIPYNSKIIPRNTIIQLPPPKSADPGNTSHVATRDTTPHGSARGKKAKPN